MTTRSTRWSSASVPCRIDWRPSRCLVGALVLLSACAPAAVAASELPAPVAWPLAAAAALHGLWLARREWRRPRSSLLFTADGRLLVDDVAVDAVELPWRGPLAFLRRRGADGRRAGLAWWPDTLPGR